MVWKQTHNSSEVCLYMSRGKPFGKMGPQTECTWKFWFMLLLCKCRRELHSQVSRAVHTRGCRSPGVSRIGKQKGTKRTLYRWIVGCVVIQQWEGIYIFCQRKHEMVVLLGLNPWEKCASFKGKKQKGSWRDEVQWVSYNTKPERKILMISMSVHMQTEVETHLSSTWTFAYCCAWDNL